MSLDFVVLKWYLKKGVSNTWEVDMKVIGMILLCCFLVGCDQLRGKKGDAGDVGADGARGLTGLKGDKGDKGDTGTSTLLSTKIYTGTPTANIHGVYCAEITNNNNQVINIYMVLDGTTLVALPFTGPSWQHYYMRDTGSKWIYFATASSPSPATALYDDAWGQSGYRIEILTFATSSAAQSYKASLMPKRRDTINYLVGTE